MSSPVVSIVMATFNRSNVLRLSIEAACASSFTDWELIVVGDGCTDDTEEVVRTFRDPRMTFTNLPKNSGEQATPNNEGLRRARGEYIAFLNHDDLWTSDHLAGCLQSIEGADLVTAILAGINQGGEVHLQGVCPNGVYLPWIVFPASSWLMRRELAMRVGPWRPGRELFMLPSQEWLFRAWKSGARIRSTGRATVIGIGSGSRAGSYSERQVDEHAHYSGQLRTDPDLISRLLAPVAVRLTADINGASAGALLVRAARIMVRRALLALGVHPHAVWDRFRYRRRGGQLDLLRRIRGLSPLPRGE